jgi:hypothetical protein
MPPRGLARSVAALQHDNGRRCQKFKCPEIKCPVNKISGAAPAQTASGERTDYPGIPGFPLLLVTVRPQSAIYIESGITGRLPRKSTGRTWLGWD